MAIIDGGPSALYRTSDWVILKPDPSSDCSEALLRFLQLLLMTVVCSVHTIENFIWSFEYQFEGQGSTRER